MRLVVFGLSLSSSWGNGHATLWRGLCRGLAQRSHRTVFFERDVPYYRNHRDCTHVEGSELVLYEDWASIAERARRELDSADAAIVTSFCPDGRAASRLVLERTRGVRVFYDMDTPVTLAALEAGQSPPYLLGEGLGEFDLVLSFTGGRALDELRTRLGARRVAPLYGHVDPEVHRPVPADDAFLSGLSYLGTYAADRQDGVEELFLAPARSARDVTFRLAGASYPDRETWPKNLVHHEHLAPSDHPRFFASSRLTLNVTRGAMARYGHCPSGRLFEAAACGVPLASDWFEGLERFYDPERELFVVRSRDDVRSLLDTSDAELARRARAARERTLAVHTSAARARELEQLLWAPPERPRATAALGATE